MSAHAEPVNNKSSFSDRLRSGRETWLKVGARFTGLLLFDAEFLGLALQALCLRPLRGRV